MIRAFILFPDAGLAKCIEIHDSFLLPIHATTPCETQRYYIPEKIESVPVPYKAIGSQETLIAEKT